MSIRTIQGSTLPTKILPGATYLNGEWVRNPSWLPLASITSSDQKFTGLYQINRYANFIALNFTTSGGAQYTVDWGDGSAPQNINSATQANYEYDWNDADLNGTNAPVTFQDSGDTVTRNNHGYLDGMNISFAEIVTTTGIVATQTYYVVNATTNTFQVSDTIGGTPIALTNDGTGTILPYKQVVITVTPVSGNLTVGDLYVKHNQSGLANGYTTGWLDVAFAGSYTTLTIGNSGTNVRQGSLQQGHILSSALTSYADLFRNCFSLQNVIDIKSSATVTNMSGTFQNCTSLQKLSLFDTANVINMSNVFNTCRKLVEVPLFNTSNVANTLGMFSLCSALQKIPLFDLSNVTITSQMFDGCVSLTQVPLLNTANVTNMGSMFNGCASLTQVPLFNTANVTITASMFSECRSLSTVPLFNLSNVTNMGSMFVNCISLQEIPLFDTGNASAVGGMGVMFNNCNALQKLPILNTSNATSLSVAFTSAFNLQEIPELDCRKIGTMFTAPPSVSRIKTTGTIVNFTVSNAKLSNVALNEIYTNLGRVGNVGTANNSVTFQATGDTVTKVGHGFANLDAVRFSTITTTTGISINTNYYVINATANTFQVTSTLTDSAIDLVNNGTGLIANATITVTGNYGTASDDPTIATSKGWVVTGS